MSEIETVRAELAVWREKAETYDRECRLQASEINELSAERDTWRSKAQTFEHECGRLEEELALVRAAAAATQPGEMGAGVPEGWKLVPVKPTPEMLYAMAECDGYLRGDRDHPSLVRWEDYWRKGLGAVAQSADAVFGAHPMRAKDVAAAAQQDDCPQPELCKGAACEFCVETSAQQDEHCQCPACAKGTIHGSDCAVHNAPAYPNGPCDCGVSAQQDEREARCTKVRREREDGDGRWEVGFRNIVTVLGGARESFEIKEVVEAVRVMTGEPAQGPTPAWWKAAHAGAQADSDDNVFDWLETELSAVDCVYRGSPTYDHDAYWFREKAIALVAEARNIFAQQVQADAQQDEREAMQKRWASNAQIPNGLGMVHDLWEAAQLTGSGDSITAALARMNVIMSAAQQVHAGASAESDKRDAARYRELRENHVRADENGFAQIHFEMARQCGGLHGQILDEHIDADIDAAMSREQSQEGGDGAR